MSDKLVWIDLEMTGLENTDSIMEIACLITDKDLNIIEKGPEIVIRHSRERLDQMGEWCTKHHGDNGLTDACINSKFTVQDAESKVVDFIKKHLDQEQGMLAGNSVHADKQFLIREMPRIVELLHYRIVDVSTIKELCRRWYPKEFAEAPRKGNAHRAMDDIVESVNELKYYRNAVFK